MEQMEMLWAYMQEDIKAEKVARELRTSPLRQKLEKTRDYILAQQNAYKQIEEHVAISADRKDAVRDALVRCDEQLKSLEKRFVEDPPQDVESAKQMISEVEKCRKTATTYEQEMRRLNKESNEIDNKARSIRQGAAQAKHDFDQMKVEYNKESAEKKAQYEKLRAEADKKTVGILPDLLAIYATVKKQITPPMARLINGQCSGCNTSQPSAALRKIDAGSDIVECETCGRILIKSKE